MKLTTTLILCLLFLIACQAKNAPSETSSASPSPSSVSTPVITPSVSDLPSVTTPIPEQNQNTNNFEAEITKLTTDSIYLKYKDIEFEVLADQVGIITTKDGMREGLNIKVTFEGKISEDTDVKSVKITSIEEIDE